MTRRELIDFLKDFRLFSTIIYVTIGTLIVPILLNENEKIGAIVAAIDLTLLFVHGMGSAWLEDQLERDK